MSSSTVVGTFVFELSIVLSDDLSGSISSLISSRTICVVEVAVDSLSLSVVVPVVPAKKLAVVPVLISSWTICVVEVASVSVSLSVVVPVVPAKKLAVVPVHASELPIIVSATLSVLWIVLLFQIVMYFSTQQFFGEVEQ